MSLVTYVLQAGVTGGTVNEGNGTSFNVGPAIIAGGGQFTVDDQINPALVAALDSSKIVVRSGIAAGPPIGTDIVAPVYAHYRNLTDQIGDLLQRGADGEFSAIQPALLSVYSFILPAAQTVFTTNQALTGLPSNDGYNVQENDRVLLTAQSTGSQNGPWLAHAAGWQRPPDYPAGGVVGSKIIQIVNGTKYAVSLWGTQNTTIHIDTDTTTWLYVNQPALQAGWVRKSANYTLARTDSGAIVTATATIQLPASPLPVRYGVKILGAGIVATVSTGSGAKIDNGGAINATSMSFSANGQSYDFAPDGNGTDWIIV